MLFEKKIQQVVRAANHGADLPSFGMSGKPFQNLNGFPSVTVHHRATADDQ